MPMPDAFALPESIAARADQDRLFDQYRAGLEVTVWDRRSPINGQAADYWLSRDDVPASGDIYLIGANGHTQVFQPHHPQGGPIAPGDGEALGNDHADRIAAGRVHGIVAPAHPGQAPDPAVVEAAHAVATWGRPASPPHPQPTPPPAPAPPAGPALPAAHGQGQP